jgi:hypothetical protein
VQNIHCNVPMRREFVPPRKSLAPPVSDDPSARAGPNTCRSVGNVERSPLAVERLFLRLRGRVVAAGPSPGSGGLCPVGHRTPGCGCVPTSPPPEQGVPRSASGGPHPRRPRLHAYSQLFPEGERRDSNPPECE